MHLSFTPFVPTQHSPYAGHQFYAALLSAVAGERKVTVVAPRTEENVRAVTASRAFDVHLTDHFPTDESVVARARRTAGFWKLTELHPMPVIDPQVREWCGRADSFDLQWSESLVFSEDLARYRRPVFAVAYDILWTTIAAKPGPRLIGRQVAPLRRAAVRRAEIGALSHCGMVVVFKAADAELLTRAGYKGRAIVASPTLDEPSGQLRPENPPNVVFIGAFDRRENYEGASWFLDEVLPRIRSSGVGAHFVFAGSGMPAALAARATELGVETTGYLPDLDPVYRRATVAMAPIHRPGGLRFKVPQAMKYGLPVVATSEALRGLEAAPDGVLPPPVDRPDAFADAICSLLADEGRRVAVGEAGKAWVDAQFSSDRTFGEILEWIATESRG